MSAVRASPNCETGVEGYGEVVVVTECMRRWCQGLGERGAIEAQCKRYGFADDRITVMHLLEIIMSGIFFQKAKQHTK
jgi:hypothetical protein